MVNNAKTIGGLIVNEALLRGEQELLSNRNPSQQNMGGNDAAPQTAPPISHNDKAMAPVLLTLLDEQLNGTIVDEASRMGAREGEVSSSPNRVAARYAEDDQMFRADLPAGGTAIPHGQIYPHIAQTVPSLDLQFFMQRFLVGKTKNIQADVRGGPHSGERGPKAAADPISGASMMKIAGIVVGVTLVLIVLAVRHFG
ncbi:hypothetical protein [Hyphomicrobium sp. 99]|uniref:hypothetical protein n=1 Tax=Hyphomicrobium sp. 99 TaxID=1163419 RepID=UPI0005F839B9|nr:hypothetical protein [Hyphomicrobium sp. 99]